MFTKKDKQELLDEIVAKAGKLQDEVNDLQRKISDLCIDESRLTEQHEREKREVEHMVGLERKRSEFEIEQARRETMVEVKQANLKADRARFEEQMRFIEERMSKEVSYLKDDILKGILDRLPTVTVDRTINELRTSKGA